MAQRSWMITVMPVTDPGLPFPQGRATTGNDAMRNYSTFKGYTTRIVFDAAHGQFVDMRAGNVCELTLEANDNVVKLMQPQANGQLRPRAIRPRIKASANTG
jgi:hypothetical protein